MIRTNLANAVRHLRHQRGWRQLDLARHAGTSRQVVSKIERGLFTEIPLRTVERITAALEASVDLTVRWRGAELDRLTDATHARLAETTLRLFTTLGWDPRVEVSFNHYGDRGRVDVLAMHTATSTLAVVELKSAIGDMQDLLGRLDVKVRLGPMLADSVGWPRPRRVVPVLVIGESRAARRVIRDHDAVFRRFDVRGRQAWAWLRRPAMARPAPTGLLWFVNLPRAHRSGTRRVERVRRVQGGG